MGVSIASMDQKLVDDEAALRLYARMGDAEAFELLVRRYGAMVLATCRRHLASDADAEDAAQETFYKLATGASSIKSNVAAWLHRCAIGTSVDVVRKASSRKRAERSASLALPVEGTRDQHEAILWRDLEPIIDKALSELSSEDQGLIVARYLAGRSQAELARSLHVSEGTVSRRLSRAVIKLRERLGAHGALVAAGGSGAVLVAALESGSEGIVLSPKLGMSLGKIGLSGVGAGVGGGAWSVGKATLVTAVIAAVGTTALVATQLPGFASGVSSSGVVQTRDLGPPVPEGTIGPFQIITATDATFQDRGIWITDRQMQIRHGFTTEDESVRTILDITSIEVVPDDPTTRDLEERGVMRTRVRQILPADLEFSRFHDSTVVDISVGFDGFGRLVLQDVDGKVQIGRNEPRWFGVRPPVGWAEASRVPVEKGELGILGPWTESERVPVTITAQEIRFGTSDWSKERYRVIEWEQVEGWSRVLSVNGGGRDPRLIGTRFRLLLREDENGYTMAYYPREVDRAGSWPTSFEYSASNPVRVVSFERDGGGR